MINLRLTSFLRPMIKSALTLFVCALICNTLLVFYNPAYHIRASRGMGKIACTIIVLINLFGLLRSCSIETQKKFFRDSIFFLYADRWIGKFVSFFTFFFFAHLAVLAAVYTAGYASWQTPELSVILGALPVLALAALATFFLALTEEIIFRGAFFTYCSSYFSPLTSALFTSLCFSLAHDLYNPLSLVSSQLPLGVGLFLLGLLLNLIVIKTGKIYTAMGAHAGLVFLKVILRKISCFSFVSAAQLPWYLSADLRAAPIIHLLFFCVIATLLISMKNSLSLTGKKELLPART